MKNSNYKSILKNLNRQPADQAFLSNFRQELDSFVQARPIAQPGFFMLFTKSAIVLGAVVFMVLSGGGLVYASLGSLPGQILYPVKIAAEEARLSITKQPEKRKELQLEFINKRINEANMISKENNASHNAEKALAIIDEKIKEIEKLESEDASSTAESHSLENEPTRATPAIQPTATATQSATSEYEKLRGKSDIRPDRERRSGSDAFEKSKARLKESHAILEQLIRSSRQGDKEKNSGDRLNKELLDSPIDASTKIEDREPKTKSKDESSSSSRTIKKENDSRNSEKEKRRSDEQRKEEELRKQKEAEKDSR